MNSNQKRIPVNKKQKVPNQTVFCLLSQNSFNLKETPESSFLTKNSLEKLILKNFLRNSIIFTPRMNSKTEVKIVCEYVQNDETFEIILMGSAWGRNSLIYATPYGYMGGIANGTSPTNLEEIK